MPSARAAARAGASGGRDIGLHEIVTLEEQRRAMRLGERIGEAIAHVERGRMTALAEAVEGVKGKMTLAALDRHNVDSKVADKLVDIGHGLTDGRFEPSADSQGSLKNRQWRRYGSLAAGKRVDEPIRLGLAKDDRRQSRSIDEDHSSFSQS